jgi:beta-ureidopropionase / N-carbamoyl-L-amino-acid hydrolase
MLHMTAATLNPASLNLELLNAASPDGFVALLDGIYEHSPWVARGALAARPLKSLAHLKYALSQSVRAAGTDAQIGLIRAHPELAGKAMVAGTLTVQSTGEQARAGLTHCTPAEFATLKQLNDDYKAKFGWPFIVAVRGDRGLGLTRQQIIATFTRRLAGSAAFERAECLRNIDRIAEIRLNDSFGYTPTVGNQVWDWCEALAQFSDAQQGADPAEHENPAERALTVTYLTPAHRACAALLTQQMRSCGFDEVAVDAVGNVVGRYFAADRSAKTLLTGSHYDTVRNGGKFDGRLGIYLPMACVQALHAKGKRLPFALEVVGFAEEEGQRYQATFLGSGALIGHFQPEWLAQTDTQGISMRSALLAAGLQPDDIPKLARNPADYLGFIEVHIEQGPVLNELDLPLGVVTSINGSVRYVGSVFGTACHAGTTPMGRRADAALAVAELALYVEQRAKAQPHLVGTVGMMHVPNGSINVVPGRCDFSLDLRAPTDTDRDRLVADVLAQLNTIAAQRGVTFTLDETVRASAAPSNPALQAQWEAAVAATGLPVHRLPSGAGHDAMKLHEAMPQAMLFVRGGNSGISHNPLEATTNDDMQLAFEAMMGVLAQGTWGLPASNSI